MQALSCAMTNFGRAYSRYVRVEDDKVAFLCWQHGARSSWGEVESVTLSVYPRHRVYRFESKAFCPKSWRHRRYMSS